MAFVSNPEDEQKNQQGQGGQGNPLAMQAPVPTSSAPGAGPGAAPSSAATGAVASNQASPQPFTNLQAYLTANQPQIQQQGQTIANNLTQGYGQVQNDINAGTQGFKDQVSSGYTAPNQDVINQATSNPTDFVKDQNNVTAFKKQLNDTYAGPQNFEGSDYYANLNKEVQKATTDAGQVNTPEGLQNYLMGYETNPTKGDTVLDQVLLQGNPDAYKGVTQAAAPYAGLSDYLSGLIPQQNQTVQDAQTNAAQTAQNAQDKIGQKSTDFGNELNSKYQQGTQGAIDYNTMLNGISQKIANNNYASLTPQEQALIGYNSADTDLFQKYPTIFPTQAQNHPINFSNYFTQGPQASIPQASDIVTPDQMAEFQALQMLSGNAPQTNFAMPTESTSNSYSLPSQTPFFNNSQALQSIYDIYNPMYSQTPGGSITPEMKQYMDKLAQILGQPQPNPQPAGPQPQPIDPQHPIGGGKLGFV